jgi:hypothetical protein
LINPRGALRYQVLFRGSGPDLGSVNYSILVHVPHLLDSKPTSVGAIVTTAGVLVFSLAVMFSRPPLKPIIFISFYYLLPANPLFSEARPAGFEPATRGLEVRNERTLRNNLKRERCLFKPNSQGLRLLEVSGCLHGLESG